MAASGRAARGGERATLSCEPCGIASLRPSRSGVRSAGYGNSFARRAHRTTFGVGSSCFARCGARAAAAAQGRCRRARGARLHGSRAREALGPIAGVRQRIDRARLGYRDGSRSRELFPARPARAPRSSVDELTEQYELARDDVTWNLSRLCEWFDSTVRLTLLATRSQQSCAGLAADLSANGSSIELVARETRGDSRPQPRSSRVLRRCRLPPPVGLREQTARLFLTEPTRRRRKLR